jgi:hypothetical protein
MESPAHLRALGEKLRRGGSFGCGMVAQATGQVLALSRSLVSSWALIWV